MVVLKKKKKRSWLKLMMISQRDLCAAWGTCDAWPPTNHPLALATTTKEHDPLNGMCISIFLRSFFFDADLNFIAYIVSKLRSTWFQGVRWKPATGPNASYGPWWVFLFFFFSLFVFLHGANLCFVASRSLRRVQMRLVDLGECFFFFFFLFVCVFTWC